MFEKETNLILRGMRLLLVIIIVIMNLSSYVPRSYAVYKYDNEEKEIHIWLVGIAQTEAGYLTLEGNIEPVIDSGLYRPGYYYNGEIALYLRGKIKGEYLINALYDTAKENPYNKLFSTIEPDKYYPVYGDSSSLKRVGESQDKLYICIQHRESSLSYGSYETGFGETKFTPYSRTLQGIKADYKVKDFSLTAFGAITPQIAFHDEIRGDGTSGYYRLSHKDVIEGSDKVVIEVRDKDDPDKVIKSKSLKRDIDYFLDYSEGMLLFKEPVPSRDEDDNPVWIIIDYEYMPESGDLKHNILGIRAEVEPSHNFKMGATYLSDTDSPSKSQVYGLDITGSLGSNGRNLKEPKTKVRAEFAHSINGAETINPEDNAFSAEITTKLIENLELKSYYRGVGKDFHHPQKEYDNGTQKYGAEAKLKFTDNLGITGKHSYLVNKLNENETITSEIGFLYKTDSFTIKPEYKQTQYFDLLDFAKEKLIRGQGINIEAKLSDKFTAKGSYEAEDIEFINNPAKAKEKANTIGLGGRYKLNDEIEVFTDYSINNQNGKQSTATTVGVNTKVFDNTNLYSRYTIDGGIGGERNQASIGMNTRVVLADGLSANLALEKELVREEGKVDKYTTAFSGILEYLPDEDLKSSLKYEMRLAPEKTKKIIMYNTTGKMSEDFTLIGKLEKYEEYYNDTSFEPVFAKQKYLIGLAYRPVNKDRFNALLKHEQEELKDLTEEPITDIITTISSIEGIYDLNPKLQLFGKYALRKKTDISVPPATTSTSDLLIASTTYKLTPRLDLGGEYRIMRLKEAQESKSGYSLELGYYLIKQIKLILGYTWSAYDDVRFSENDYWVKGPYLRLLYKF